MWFMKGGQFWTVRGRGQTQRSTSSFSSFMVWEMCCRFVIPFSPESPRTFRGAALRGVLYGNLSPRFIWNLLLGSISLSTLPLKVLKTNFTLSFALCLCQASWALLGLYFPVIDLKNLHNLLFCALFLLSLALETRGPSKRERSLWFGLYLLCVGSGSTSLRNKVARIRSARINSTPGSLHDCHNMSQ